MLVTDDYTEKNLTGQLHQIYYYALIFSNI